MHKKLGYRLFTGLSALIMCVSVYGAGIPSGINGYEPKVPDRLRRA